MTQETQQTKSRYLFQDHIPGPSEAQLDLLKRILPDKPPEELERMLPTEARRIIGEHMDSGKPLAPSRKQKQFLRWWGLWHDEKPLDSRQAHTLIDAVKKKIAGFSPDDFKQANESSRLAAKGDPAGMPILTREEVEGIVGRERAVVEGSPTTPTG